MCKKLRSAVHQPLLVRIALTGMCELCSPGAKYCSKYQGSSTLVMCELVVPNIVMNRRHKSASHWSGSTRTCTSPPAFLWPLPWPYTWTRNLGPSSRTYPVLQKQIIWGWIQSELVVCLAKTACWQNQQSNEYLGNCNSTVQCHYCAVLDS